MTVNQKAGSPNRATNSSASMSPKHTLETVPSEHTFSSSEGAAVVLGSRVVETSAGVVIIAMGAAVVSGAGKTVNAQSQPEQSHPWVPSNSRQSKGVMGDESQWSHDSPKQPAGRHNLVVLVVDVVVVVVVLVLSVVAPKSLLLSKVVLMPKTTCVLQQVSPSHTIVHNSRGVCFDLETQLKGPANGGADGPSCAELLLLRVRARVRLCRILAK